MEVEASGAGGVTGPPPSFPLPSPSSLPEPGGVRGGLGGGLGSTVTLKLKLASNPFGSRAVTAIRVCPVFLGVMRRPVPSTAAVATASLLDAAV